MSVDRQAMSKDPSRKPQAVTRRGPGKQLAGTALVVCSLVLGACASKPKPVLIPTPEPSLGAAQIQQTPRGPMLTVEDVLFDFDQAGLRASEQPVLAQAVSYLKQHPARTAIIEGHADAIGDEAYNQGLSAARSQAVHDALRDAGIAPGRIRTAAFGEERPVAENDSAAGRQANRRVEILFKSAER